MKLKALFLTAALFAGMLAGCTNTPKETENMKNSPIPLANTYYKLTKDKALNIAFIGGSITDGYGASDRTEKPWVNIVTNHFKEAYPEADINSHKLSIGGTCSYFATFRYNREIAAKNPDLLFIEYALNDNYQSLSYDQVVRTSESLVRLAHKANPNIDIVYVLTFNNSSLKNTDYDQLKAHRDVAQFYNLAHIKLADKFYPMLEATGGKASDYLGDGTHPNDNGYAYYADIISEYVDTELALAAEKGAAELCARELGEKTLSNNVMSRAHTVYSNEIVLKDVSGWEHQEKNFSTASRLKDYGGRIYSDTIGSKFTFEFEGTDLGFAINAGPKMGYVNVTIDGGEPIRVEGYRSSNNPKARIVAENLEYGKHTVTVELAGKNVKSDGYEFHLGALLVN